MYRRFITLNHYLGNVSEYFFNTSYKNTLEFLKLDLFKLKAKPKTNLIPCFSHLLPHASCNHQAVLYIYELFFPIYASDFTCKRSYGICL